MAARSASFLCLQMSKSDNFGEKMKEFMQKYDKNSDGKIEMAEVRAKMGVRGGGGLQRVEGPRRVRGRG